MSSDDRRDERSQRRPEPDDGRVTGRASGEPPAAEVAPSIDTARRGNESSEPSGDADMRERARAAAFGELVESLVSGQGLPPAMTADERALIETAAIVRAASRDIEPAPERVSALIDDVLGAAAAEPKALGARASEEAAPSPVRLAAAPALRGDDEVAATDAGPGERAEDAPEAEPGPSDSAIISLDERRRGRFLRVLPWSVTVASVAAALVLVFWQGQRGELIPGGGLSSTEERAAGAAGLATALQDVHHSRPSDVLIGEIARPRAAAARARIDMIYADRLSGYRDLRLRGGRL